MTNEKTMSYLIDNKHRLDTLEVDSEKEDYVLYIENCHELLDIAEDEFIEHAIESFKTVTMGLLKNDEADYSDEILRQFVKNLQM